MVKIKMEIVESYNQKDLSNGVNTPVSRIKKDKDLYIPIKIDTAQSRATKRGYSVRYVKKDDVIEYITENTKIRKKDYLRKNTWKKE